MLYRDVMFKKKPSAIDSSVSKNKSDTTPKLSYKQQLAKLFLTSDIKNPILWKPLRAAKSQMMKNFHDGGVDSPDVDALFWAYFDQHKDIFIPKHLKSRLSNYKVFVPNMPNDRALTLEEYLYILRYIRKALGPLMKQVQSFKSSASYYAHEAMKQEDLEVYTDYDREDQKQQYAIYARQKFSELMSIVSHDKVAYDQQRFDEQSEQVAQMRMHDDYHSLIIFTVLGMHYFNKKKDVYNTFMEEDLQKKLAFPMSKPSFNYAFLTIEEFLRIIDQLDFKKHFFDL